MKIKTMGNVFFAIFCVSSQQIWKRMEMAIKGKVWVALVATLLSVVGCSDEQVQDNCPCACGKSIVIMYDSDVHCELEGYVGFAGLRDAIALPDTADVLTVSSGDFLQGGPYGALSSGGYVVEMMNSVGYDVVTLGNHEFDYGVPRLEELMRQLNTSVTCVNLTASGLEKSLYPRFVMKEAGGKRVAFVGALTPDALYSESYAFKDEQDRYVYDLNASSLLTWIQDAVDEARAQKADYVILLSHIGEEEAYYYPAINSPAIIQATKGIDVVLDAHSHHLIDQWVTNAEGKSVQLLNSGTAFKTYGKIWIGADGVSIVGENIPAESVAYASEEVQRQFDQITLENEKQMNEPVCEAPFRLTIDGPDGNRAIRNAETNLGDLVCDAYAQVAGTRIALCNGGAIRASMPVGKLTYKDVLAVNPYFNDLCIIKATGQQLLDALEVGAQLCPAETGAFLQCAGLRYAIDTRIQNKLTIGADNVLTVSGNRRVTQLEVQQADGTYRPIDLTADYEVTVSEYVAYSGDEIRVLKPCPVLAKGIVSDTEALYRFLKNNFSAGELPAYYGYPQGRITIVK